MHTRKLRTTFVAALAALLPTLAAPTAAPAQAATDVALPLWELSHERGTLYLLGSVHLLRPEVYPLDPAIYEAFDAADLVAFELTFEEVMAAAPLMMQVGMYTDGSTLRDAVPASLYRQVVARSEQLGIPAQVLDRMKPWMASMMLSTLVLQRAGYEAQSGIEMHFYERAREAGKETVGLETAAEQFAALDGLGPEAQVAMLEQTLEDLDDTVAELDEATAMWQRGDVEGLAALLQESMGEQPELEERLLHARNRNWIAPIEALMERGGTSMVVVGMGHLVGEGSVVELLRARGHAVVRLEPAGISGSPSGW